MTFFSRFSEWQNYIHYLMLTAGVSGVAYYFGAPIDFRMFWILFGSIFVVDTIVHSIFWFAKPPIRWRD